MSRNKIVSVAKKKGFGIIVREIPKSTVQSTPYGTRKAMDSVYDSVHQVVYSRKLDSDNLIVCICLANFSHYMPFHAHSSDIL